MESLLEKTVVIIPARNEADNITEVISDIHAHLPGADVVVVDDHSDDSTGEIAASLPRVTVVRSPIPLGIGAAVQLGLKCALERGYERFIRMDGDGQHKASCLPDLLKRGAPGALVQGSRPRAQFLATSNWVRKIGSAYFHLLFLAFAGKEVPDPTSGLMCFDRGIAEKFARFFPTDFPEIESLVLLIRSGHEVRCLPVAMRPRQNGESSIGVLHGAIYMFSVTLAFFSSFLRRNPYRAAHAH